MIWPFVILAAVLLIFIHHALGRLDELERRMRGLEMQRPSQRSHG